MSSYLTVDQLKATLGITSDASNDDLTAAIGAASGAVDNICRRGRNAFNKDADAAEVRYYSPRDPSRLEIDDLVQVTTVASRDDGGNVDTADGGLNTWTEFTDYLLEPLNAAAGTGVDAWPYTHIRVTPLGSFTFNTFFPRSVKVTGQFGWPEVPQAVLDSVTLLAERLYKMKRESPLGVIEFDQVAIRMGRADQNIMILLGPYMKHRAAIA